MRAAIVAALASVAFSASAEPTYADKNITVRLGDQPCAGFVADVILPMVSEEAKNFHAASVTFQGREIAACWQASGDNALIIDAEGSGGVIPFAEFKNDKGL